MSMSVVTQRQSMAWSGTLSTLKILLDRIGGPGTCEVIEQDKKIIAHGCINISVEGKIIILEWQATPVNDMFADSVLACVMQTELGGTNLKGTLNTGTEKSDRAHFIGCLIETFQDTFGDSAVPKEVNGRILPLTVSGKQAEVDLESFEVTSNDEQLQQIVNTTVQKLYQALINVT